MPNYVADLDSVFHELADPGRRLMLELTGRFGSHREQMFLNLAESGNCVAASILLAFAKAVTCGTIQRAVVYCSSAQEPVLP